MDIIRRRGMEQVENGPLYPFPDYRTMVYDGNHISFSGFNGQARWFGLSIGTYVYSNNSTTGGNAINNKPTLFTIPAGAVVVIAATLTTKRGQICSFGFRRANATDSLWSSGNLGSGTHTFTYTPDSDVEVGTFFAYVSPTGFSHEFDAVFECYIDGVRYF